MSRVFQTSNGWLITSAASFQIDVVAESQKHPVLVFSALLSPLPIQRRRQAWKSSRSGFETGQACDFLYG